MGLGMLQPMHLFAILLTMVLPTAVGIGIAIFLIRYAVRYNRQLEEQSRNERSRE